MILDNKRHATEVLPILEDYEIEEKWAGIMPFTVDGVPIVGRIDGVGAPLYVCTGLGGSGFCRGPGAGLLLASLINDGRLHSELPKDFVNDWPTTVLRETNPNRF